MPSLIQKHAHVKGQRSNHHIYKFQPKPSWAKKRLNRYTSFGENLTICSKAIERKPNSGVNQGPYVCMSYRVPPLTYRRTPSSHKDRKGSFTTRPTGKVPGYKNVLKKGLLFTATSMLAQYQQGGRGLYRWWGKQESLEKNHRKLVRNRQTV